MNIIEITDPIITAFFLREGFVDMKIEINVENEIGRGSNGAVYKANSGYFESQIVLKTTKLNKKKKKDINFYCRSIVSSIGINSFFPSCRDNFLCSYGIIINELNIEDIEEEIMDNLKEKDLIFISEEVPKDVIYLMYKFINGVDLRKKIKQAIEDGIDIDYVNYMSQILQNLVFLQSLGFVHLDIKPENFMIDDRNNVIFIDTEFLCNNQSVNCKLTAMTPNYISLEGYDAITLGALNETLLKKKYPDKTYLFKTDVFSCGLVFYEMIMKTQSNHKIFEYGKKMEGPELVLEFSEDKLIWEPLIVGMTKRYYTERLSSFEAITLFNEIRSAIFLETSTKDIGGGKHKLKIHKLKRKSKRKSRRKNSKKR